MYRTLLFDFDGTICSSIATIVVAIQATFRHFNRPVPSAAAVAKMAASGPDLAGSFYQLDPDLGPLDDATMQVWSTIYRQAYKAADAAHSTLYPGIVELLTLLEQRGTEMIIVSNKSIDSIERSLEQFKLRSFFTEIYGDSIQHPPKPDPMLFTHHILPARPDHKLQDFLMIGDTVTDYAFSQACGIDMAWVAYGYGQLSSEEQQLTTFCADSPAQLMAQLESRV